MKWYLKCLKQYADFSGRARRTEYWMFVLFNILFAVLTIFIGFLLEYLLKFYAIGFGLYFLYILAIIIPSFSVVVRRLHDTGNSGWMYFISLIPIIGFIWLIVLLVTDSQPGENKWGPNPKGN
tara:strand:+ start:83 stop:451 length:369 start_codon:yes stop_codon:yes gene_type:complete